MNRLEKVVWVGVVSAVTACTAPAAQEPGPGRDVTQADPDRWKVELSNWGRWGPDDEIGTMNLVTPDKRRAAAALVREGISVSLAQDVLKEEAVDNPNPFEHTMRGVGSDAFAVSYHGWAHTHLDALAHVRDEDGAMYNGYRPDESTVMAAGGHARNSIHNLKSGVFTRGILMDMPRLHGLPYLEPETPNLRGGPGGVGTCGGRAGRRRRRRLHTDGALGGARGVGTVPHRPNRPVGRVASVGDSLVAGTRHRPARQRRGAGGCAVRASRRGP